MMPLPDPAAQGTEARPAQTRGAGSAAIGLPGLFISGDGEAEKRVSNFPESGRKAQNCWPCSGRGLAGASLPSDRAAFVDSRAP